MIRAPIKMLVSRTTRTCGVHLIVDQVEYLLLAISVIAILDLANGEIQHATAHGFIDEPGQVALLAAGAGKIKCGPLCLFFQGWKGSIGSWVKSPGTGAYAAMRPSYRLSINSVNFLSVQAGQYHLLARPRGSPRCFQ